MKRLLSVLLANVATIFLSLILAVVIWVVAVRENDPTVNSPTLRLPVTFVNEPPDSFRDTTENAVELIVSGPESIIQDIAKSDFVAEVDLADAPWGTSQQSIDIRHEIDLVEVAFLFPEQLSVSLERRISSEVPVTVLVRGQAGRGYELEDTVASPDIITITGPTPLVKPIEEARVSIFLDDAREDVTLSRRPTFYDAQGDIIAVPVEFLDSETVQVSALVNELEGFGEKPVVAVWDGSPALGYRLLDVSVEPAAVLLTGRPSVIASIGLVETESVNIQDMTETVSLPVFLALPDGTTMANDLESDIAPSPVVTMTITIDPIVSTSLYQIEPTVRALGEGLEVELSPESVRVQLEGPLDKLDTVSPAEDIEVTLDLFDLEPGTHAVAPSVNVLLSDLEVQSFQPMQVTVTITEILEDEE